MKHNIFFGTTSALQRKGWASQSGFVSTHFAKPTRHFFMQRARNGRVMQEMIRHSTIRVTLNTYTQAVTAGKGSAVDSCHQVLRREI
jgi:hypothetical protein